MGQAFSIALAVLSLAGCGPRTLRVTQSSDPRHAPELESNTTAEQVGGEHIEDPGQPAAPDPGQSLATGLDQPAAIEPVEARPATEGATEAGCPVPMPVQATDVLTAAVQVVQGRDVPVLGARVVIRNFADDLVPGTPNRCFAVAAEGITGRDGRFEVALQRFGPPYDHAGHGIEVERGDLRGFTMAMSRDLHRPVRIRARPTGLLDVEVSCADVPMPLPTFGFPRLAGLSVLLDGRLIPLVPRPSAPNLFGANVRVTTGLRRLAIASLVCGVYTQMVRIRRGSTSPVSVTLPRPDAGAVQLSFPRPDAPSVYMYSDGTFIREIRPDASATLLLGGVAPGVYQFRAPLARNVPSCVSQVEVLPDRTVQLSLRFARCRQWLYHR